MDLNEGVVNGDNVNTTVVDAVKQLEWEVVPRDVGVIEGHYSRIAEDLREVSLEL